VLLDMGLMPYVTVFNSNISTGSSEIDLHIRCKERCSGVTSICLNIFSTSAAITYIFVLNLTSIDSKSSCNVLLFVCD